MRSLAVVFSLSVAAMSCSPAARSFSPSDRAAISGVLDAQKRAWNRGDIDAFMAGYERSDGLVFTSGGHIRRGWKTTLDRYRARYGTDKSTMGELQFEVIDVRALGADGAVVLGRWGLTGGSAAARGVFSVVVERIAGGWKIVHDHTSVTP